MRTVGIDLAAEPKKTAACQVWWDDGAPRIEWLSRGVVDDALVDRITAADKAGIDAPFGWPEPFVEAMIAHRDRASWPGRDHLDGREFRRELSFRVTDRHVTPTRRPLSVSTDKIGVTAFRCALLLDRLAPVDRVGRGKVIEVYPAAALVRWKLNPSGYKNAAGVENLGALTSDLLDRLPELVVSDEQRTEMEASDDCFDAVVCALIARAAALGLTELPPDEATSEIAAREGWIHLPHADALGRLADGRPA
jgi:predicted nuclease with RNAse H fold